MGRNNEKVALFILVQGNRFKVVGIKVFRIDNCTGNVLKDEEFFGT